MIDSFVDTLQAFPRGLVFVAVGLAVLVLGKLARDVTTRYSIDQEVTKKQNLAVALRLSGYFAGLVLVLLGALYQPLLLPGEGGLGFDRDYWLEVLRVFLYALAGIVALNLVRPLMDRAILYKFRVDDEIVEGQNVGDRKSVV